MKIRSRGSLCKAWWEAQAWEESVIPTLSLLNSLIIWFSRDFSVLSSIFIPIALKQYFSWLLRDFGALEFALTANASPFPWGGLPNSHRISILVSNWAEVVFPELIPILVPDLVASGFDVGQFSWDQSSFQPPPRYVSKVGFNPAQPFCTDYTIINFLTFWTYLNSLTSLIGMLIPCVILAAISRQRR